jgi:hypothetical protein
MTKKERNVIHDKAIEAIIKDSCASYVYQPPNRKTIIRHLKKK